MPSEMEMILAALERLETGQAQLRVDLMARMDRLQDGQTQMRNDTTTPVSRPSIAR
jgi:hypothetical protein